MQSTENNSPTEKNQTITHSGKLLIDVTASSQDIANLTDLVLLNASREKSEELIDKLHDPALHVKKATNISRRGTQAISSCI